MRTNLLTVECPLCHQFTLRYATDGEKQKMSPYLNEWKIIDQQPDTYHLMICIGCGYFEVIAPTIGYSCLYKIVKEVLFSKGN